MRARVAGVRAVHVACSEACNWAGTRGTTSTLWGMQRVQTGTNVALSTPPRAVLARGAVLASPRQRIAALPTWRGHPLAERLYLYGLPQCPQ